VSLMAIDLALGPTQELVLAGPGTEAMLRAAHSVYAPRRVVLLARPGLERAAPWTAGHVALDGKATAYLCEGHSCRRPTTDAGELARALATGRPTPASPPPGPPPAPRSGRAP